MSSSSLDPVVALGDAWRRARESLTTSFSSVRGREVTGTHMLRIGGYSAVESQLPHGKYLESAPFRAGGHRWRLEYFPNGYKDSTRGCASVVLRLLDNRFLGSAADATATCRVTILDGDGNAAYNAAMSQRVYSVRGMSGVWVDVEEAKVDALRGLKDDSLSLRCDVTIKSVEKESRIKCLLREFLLRYIMHID